MASEPPDCIRPAEMIAVVFPHPVVDVVGRRRHPPGERGRALGLATLRSSNVLDRCLFVLPPESTDVDTAALVAGGVDILSDLGIEAPRYDRTGLLFTVHQDVPLDEVYAFEEVWNDSLGDRLTTRGAVRADRRS